MSNPAAAPTNVLTKAQALLNDIPSAYMTYSDRDQYGVNQKLLKNIESLAKKLTGANMDMEMRKSFKLPLKRGENDTRGDVSLNPQDYTSKTSLARANKGAVTLRHRSYFAQVAVGAMYSELPVEPSPLAAFAQKDLCATAMRGKISADGGAENCSGRLAMAYPKVGSHVQAPPTQDEVTTALMCCGLDMYDVPKVLLVPVPFVAEEFGDAAVRMNMHADMGFPLNVKASHPGALEASVMLANTIMAHLKDVYKRDPKKGVWDYIRELEVEAPWLVATRGKCKADVYSQPKIENFMLRFYNAFPKHIMLIMQSATQVMEANARNLLQFDGGRSFSGATLVKDGADLVVAAIDRQIEEDGVGGTHMGDDTWVGKETGQIRKEQNLTAFSLDASNFDISQHAEATLKIHEALRDQLARICPIAAQIWFAYARERLVVTYSTLVTKWKHGGPSGMPMQSKINDMLMDVLMQRVMKLDVDFEDRDALEEAVKHEGDKLHMKVRLEDHYVVKGAKTLREFLHKQSFLYVGYHFYAEDQKVYVCCDVPRTMSQLPYPSLKWEKEKDKHKIMEAMRLGSIALNMGRPMEELKPAFKAFRRKAESLIIEVIAEFGDVSDDRLKWAVQDNPWAASTLPSLSGLLTALENWERLWEHPKVEPEMKGAISKLIRGSWADEVEEEETEEIEAAGYKRLNRTAAFTNLKQARITRVPVSTHPVTERNFGRPPPTAVWGPDKKKKETPLVVERGDLRMKGKQGNKDFYDDFSDAETEWEWSDEDARSE